MRKRWLSTLVTTFGMVAALAITPASAQTPEEFYKGKTVTVYVGYSPGGGYDTYARTIARHIGKHIPGEPTVIVKNRPGAGSMLLTNEIYNVLPKDGSVIGIVGRGMPMEPLFGNDKAQFEPAKFSWIGSANNEVSVCVAWHTSPVKKWEDLLTTEMIVGGTGEGADTDSFPKVMNNVLGTKLKLITGYPGGNDVLLAMERGEVDGRCGYSWSSAKSRKADWLKEGKMTVLIQMSTEKHPDLPDIPLIMDLAKNDADKAALRLIYARQEFGRPFLAPPDVPADRVAALQAAFMATMDDPDFKADAAKQDLELAPVSGERIAELIAAIYSAPPETVQRAKEATEKVDKTEISMIKI
ncbi:MAG TPA: tripartite tricarboxylate transporter substrate-binding protein, partial [Afifellaceae bacterium]|nr:tripartite tricarboxylate transporter substrate-binding protein [Afifellaceae bacterium]